MVLNYILLLPFADKASRVVWNMEAAMVKRYYLYCRKRTSDYYPNRGKTLRLDWVLYLSTLWDLANLLKDRSVGCNCTQQKRHHFLTTQKFVWLLHYQKHRIGRKQLHQFAVGIPPSVHCIKNLWLPNLLQNPW